VDVELQKPRWPQAMQHPTDMNAGPQILRSGRDKAEGAARQPYSVAADISIRLWTPAQLQANSSDISWKTASNLVCMISDVVTAAQGNPADELRAGMSAHFSNAAQALKAAKSIERSIIEFCKRRPDDCFGAAVVVHRPIELRPFLEGDPGPVSPAYSLLRQAQPGQILVSQETYEHLRDLPGLQFRALNADAATGDNELLWASPETYAHFATQLQDAVRRQPLGLAPDPDAASESIRAAEPPKTELPKPKTSGLQATAFPTARLSALDPNEPEVSWMASHRLLVSLAAVGVLALATVYALPALRKSPPPVNSSIKSQSNDSQPAPRQDGLPNSAPANHAPPVASSPESAAIAPPAASSVRKPETPAAKPIQSPPKPVEPKPLGEYAGFTARDIPGLLKKAEEDAGAGDYENARREYDIVLHLDPNNQAAKTGMSRLNLSVGRK
jgi:hypothetical protein